MAGVRWGFKKYAYSCRLPGIRAGINAFSFLTLLSRCFFIAISRTVPVRVVGNTTIQ